MSLLVLLSFYGQMKNALLVERIRIKVFSLDLMQMCLKLTECYLFHQGKGWTAYESLRPLAYSTLADLVHHVRQLLPLSDLSRAVQVRVILMA